MKLAQFKTSAGGNHVMFCDDYMGPLMVNLQGYVQLTEFVEIEFPPLPVETVVQGQLKQIDAAEQELGEKFQQKLNELAEARSKLLSLTHDTQS